MIKLIINSKNKILKKKKILPLLKRINKKLNFILIIEIYD